MLASSRSSLLCKAVLQEHKKKSLNFHMGYFWILKLGLKCIDLLVWPLLALGYPLCASIQAIENDSNSDTKNLISFWILLSLICLFEYAFMKLLEWFLLWPYFKLTMAEKYIKENGTEALEKLISGKNMTPNLNKEITAVPATGKKEKQQKMARSIEEEAVKAVPATEKIQKKPMEQNLMHSLEAETLKEIPAAEKKQLSQTSGKSLHIEQRHIKVIEKKEVPADKNANPIAPNLALNESQSSGEVDANRNAGKGRIEKRYIKVVEKKKVPADNNANLAGPNLALNESKSSGAVDANRMAGKDVEGGKLPHGAASKKMQKECTCAIGQLTTTSEETLNIHVHGRKHVAALEALRWKPKIQHVNKEQKNPQIPIATQPGSEPEKIILTDAVSQITVTG
ncbi:hypothetical protein L6164_036410 [Bauhinia variegata]|uniref:Uncharacterized protein n=1 Tax=Bauhinia variegata TaxID=167791 RepID=A0ACB9KGV5_BAUVA|nr:hypothetical protein L6164_036410 [Bauhinia variegata]